MDKCVLPIYSPFLSYIIVKQVTQLNENIDQITTDFNKLVDIALDISNRTPDTAFSEDEVNEEK